MLFGKFILHQKLECTELKTIKIFEIGWLGRKLSAREVHFCHCSKQGAEIGRSLTVRKFRVQSSLFRSLRLVM
jgi:hypothetical protein